MTSVLTVTVHIKDAISVLTLQQLQHVNRSFQSHQEYQYQSLYTVKDTHYALLTVCKHSQCSGLVKMFLTY